MQCRKKKRGAQLLGALEAPFSHGLLDVLQHDNNRRAFCGI